MIISNSNNNNNNEGIQPKKGSQPRGQCAMKWRSECTSFTPVGERMLKIKNIIYFEV